VRGLAHSTRAAKPKRIEDGQLTFDLGFEELPRDREAMLSVWQQRLSSSELGIVHAVDRSGQDRCVVIQLNKSGLGVVQPAQGLKRDKARLRNNNKPFDSVRCLGKAPLTPLTLLTSEKNIHQLNTGRRSRLGARSPQSDAGRVSLPASD